MWTLVLWIGSSWAVHQAKTRYAYPADVEQYSYYYGKTLPGYKDYPYVYSQWRRNWPSRWNTVETYLTFSALWVGSLSIHRPKL